LLKFDLRVMSVIEQIAPVVTHRLRKKILYPNLSSAPIILDEDEKGIHFGLYDDNKLIAITSLFLEGSHAQFRKFATDTDFQHQGYGSQLLRYIIDFARQEGVHTLWCNARITAIPFYQKHHFSMVGSPFKRGSIEYIKMEKEIQHH